MVLEGDRERELTPDRDPRPAAGGPNARRRLRICHVIYRLGTGGLENGLVNLINRMDPERFTHQIVCVDRAAGFAGRLARPVEIVELCKRPGFEPLFYLRAWRCFRRLAPDVVHTRNTAGLDCILPARLAGVRAVLHGEHGRTADDPEGRNPRHNLLRRLNTPWVRRFTTVSADLAGWLTATVGISARKVEVLMNGVDTDRFALGEVDRGGLLPGVPVDAVVVGTVGRLDPVKGHLDLVAAATGLNSTVHVVIVGDGPERDRLAAAIESSQVADRVHLLGERSDIPELLRGFDLFCLPSLAEGISNTLLEAMATGLPVVATAVGGNPELVVDGKTGILVPPADPAGLAAALGRLATDGPLRRRLGLAARRRAVGEFGVEEMTRRYDKCYTEVAGECGIRIDRERQ